MELLEREAELDELRSALRDAGGGSGRLVFVEAEAGVGKTALVRSACGEGEALGMRVLTARGTELERDFPFALVRQLFAPALAAAGADERDGLLAGAARPAGALVGLEPDSETANAVASIVDPSFPALDALYWLLSNLCESAPVLLAVDDAHWADPASLRFLEFLLPRLEELALLVVVAARPAEPGADAAALARLGDDDAARVLRPRALSQDAATEVVRRALGPGAEDPFCAACHEVTLGNPLLLRELLVELRERDSRGAAAEAALVRETAPPSVGRAVLLRLARLPEPAPGLAAAVAVLGDGCAPAHAAALAGVELPGAAAAIDSLAEAGIFEQGPRLAFVHPLVRNAVHADLAASERAAAHARAARLLTGDGVEPERVALHLLATPPSGDEAVVGTLTVAAQRALDRAAPEAAVAYLRRALAEPPPPQARPEIARMHITAGVRLGDKGLADDIGDPLVELSADADTFLASAWPLAMWLLASRRGDEVPGVLDRAIELAGERGDVERALELEAQLASLGQLSPPQARARFARHAGAIVPGSKGERLWLALQSWWGLFLGETAEHVGAMARAALADGRIFSEQPDSPPAGQAILVLARTEQLDLASDRIDALAAEGRARGATFAAAQASFLRAHVELMRGNAARAEAEASATVAAGRRGGWLLAVPVYLALLVDALIERKELVEADAVLARTGLPDPLPESYWWTPLLHSRGRLRLAQRRFDEATADLRELQRQNVADGIASPPLSPGSHLALALAATGDRAAARRSAAEELERAQRWGAPSAVGAALRVVGLLASGEDQLALLREAVETLEPSPVRLEVMRAQVDLGAALRRANRRSEAREPLRSALEEARAGGALEIAGRAHAELAATGEKLRPLAAGGVESLTPSERRVAELAAEGLSNRDIAQTLFLTVKTVEGHLSNAYRKLDITSRRELGAALAS
jgi:DNA-binding CsgD family transcriptional regulator